MVRARVVGVRFRRGDNVGTLQAEPALSVALLVFRRVVADADADGGLSDVREDQRAVDNLGHVRPVAEFPHNLGAGWGELEVRVDLWLEDLTSHTATQSATSVASIATKVTIRAQTRRART